MCSFSVRNTPTRTRSEPFESIPTRSHCSAREAQLCSTHSKRSPCAKIFANEWAEKGINVNAIAPGYIATPLNKSMRADPEWHRKVMDRVPIGRYGTPTDLKGTVIFLASAASDYISGITLPVDGGFLGR